MYKRQLATVAPVAMQQADVAAHNIVNSIREKELKEFKFKPVEMCIRDRAYTYTGNYTNFLELKMMREEQEEASERKRQNLLRTELAWMRRGAQARSTKQKARIERFEELSNRKVDIQNAKMEMSLGSTRLGKTVIELENVSYEVNGEKIIDDFSYIVLRLSLIHI